MAAVAAFKRFLPLGDRILVQKFKAETKTATGILLPDAAKQELNQATVFAVGPGRRTKEGELLPVATVPGDVVVIPKYGGTEVKLGDEAQ